MFKSITFEPLKSFGLNEAKVAFGFAFLQLTLILHLIPKSFLNSFSKPSTLIRPVTFSGSVEFFLFFP